MSTPSRSLNNLVCWRRLLPVLGTPAVDAAMLPAVTVCPICRADGLRVFDDQVLGGQWAHCRACQFAGDLVELAAATWQMDVPNTLVRLGEADLLSEPLPRDRIESYLRDHIRYRHRCNAFWQQAQQRPLREQNLASRTLLRRFGLLEQTHDSSWLQRSGRVVGTADTKTIQALFHPSSYAEQSRSNPNGKPSVRRGGGPGGRRLFKGSGWDEALVVPFWDMPGRICGFLFIGRDAKGGGDVLYKPLNVQPGFLRTREAGLAMWPALDELPHPLLESKLVVMSDPVVALQLHARSFRESIKPLPLVATFCNEHVETQAALAHLPQSEVVFWGPGPSVLRHARAVDAGVSTYRISGAEIDRNLRHDEPGHWIRKIGRHGSHWSAVLAEQLQQANEPTTQFLLREMRFTPDDLRRIIQSCDERLQKRLVRLEEGRQAMRKVTVRGKTVVETEAGWILERSGEVICNASIRIDEILQAVGGASYYRGRVRMSGKDISFTLPLAEIDRRGLLPALRDYLVAQRAGILLFQSRWAADALFIATSLGKPACRTVVDRVGWSPDLDCFVFPTFTISRRGKVGQVVSLASTQRHAPAAHLETPDAYMLKEDVAPLSSHRAEVAICWAVAAAIVENLLGVSMPYYRRCGIILDGKGAQETGTAVAKVLGCLGVDLSGGHNRQSDLERLTRAAGRHDWPVVVEPNQGRGLTVSSCWADSDGVRNTVLPLSPIASLSLALNPGFHMIASPGPPAPLGALHSSGAYLIPKYLQDLASRHFMTPLRPRIPLVNILRDMAEWFERLGGDPAAVRRAERFVLADQQPRAEAFLSLVHRLLKAGELAVEQADGSQKGPRPATIVSRPATGDQPRTVWVPRQALNRVLVRLGAPAINADLVAQAFHDQPGFLGTTEADGEEGWLFEEEWWSSACGEYFQPGPPRRSKAQARDAQSQIAAGDLILPGTAYSMPVAPA